MVARAGGSIIGVNLCIGDGDGKYNEEGHSWNRSQEVEIEISLFWSPVN